MIYSLAALLAGGLGTAIALWRMQVWKGRAEREQHAAQTHAQDLAIALDELATARARGEHLEDVIADLHARRKEALDALDRCNAPGAIRDLLRASLSVPEEP